MIELNRLVRKNILELKAYSSARDQYQDGILLDANENSFGSSIDTGFKQLNRYPDPYQKKIRGALSVYLKIDISNIIFGVGSDQIIDLVIRVFCDPGISNVIIPEPTYGVFKVACDINNIEVRECKLDSSFDIDLDLIMEMVDSKTKMIFLCSPNNPTGNLLNQDKIKLLAESFNGIIFIDEAYQEFSESNTFIENLNRFKNVVLSRTFSKAWGLAGLRCGYCIADKFIINHLFKIKDPYSISRPTEELIIRALANNKIMNAFVFSILQEKERLISNLKSFDFVVNIFPSNANFILVKMSNADEVFKYLNQKKIRVRIRKDNERIADCLRITVGTKKENDLLIQTLKELE